MQINHVGIFYQKADPKNFPTIVLLHRFPSTFREFDALIPQLAPKSRLLTQENAGFGLSNVSASSAVSKLRAQSGRESPRC